MAADFSQYVDLTVFDVEPGGIYLESIEVGRTSLPEFNLRVGTPEDAIFQAMAYISSLHIAAINRLPSRLMEGIIRMMGLPKQDAIPAEIDVTITLDSYEGGTVPAGTIFSYETLFEDEIQEFVFETAETIVIDAIEDPQEDEPFPSASVSAIATSPGVIPPIPTPGTQFTVLSAGTNIFTVESFANFSNGINADDDAEYLSRATTYLRSLSSAIAKSSQLDAYIATAFPEFVGRSKSYDLTYGEEGLGDITVARESDVDLKYLNNDIATLRTAEDHLFVVGDTVLISGCGSPFDGEKTLTAVSASTMTFVAVGSNTASTSASGNAATGIDSPGNVTVFAYGINSFLTETQKQQISTSVTDRSVAGLSVHVLDPTLVNLTVTANLAVSQEFELEELDESIKSVISSYLLPANFPYSENRVRKTSLISLISRIPGVVYVKSIDLAPVGSGWLPQYGDDLLFLNKGSLPIISEEDITITYEIVTI
jgi:hypothetical protein